MKIEHNGVEWHGTFGVVLEALLTDLLSDGPLRITITYETASVFDPPANPPPPLSEATLDRIRSGLDQAADSPACALHTPADGGVSARIKTGVLVELTDTALRFRSGDIPREAVLSVTVP